MGFEIGRLWMFGLWKWMTTFMLSKLGDIQPWNLPNLIQKAMLKHGGGQ